jgi:murein DD-endopeptidase MepM/ murein hydrolase activator NlpD
VSERDLRIFLPLRARAKVVETPEGGLEITFPELSIPPPSSQPVTPSAPSPSAPAAATLAPDQNWLKLYPVTGTVGDDRSAYGAGPHSGVDWGAPCGAPVHAPRGGVVLREGIATDGLTGIFVQVRYDDGVVATWAHLADTVVDVGQRVAVGTLLGHAGMTGAATGCHIHYELHDHDGDLGTLLGVIDPLAYDAALLA